MTASTPLVVLLLIAVCALTDGTIVGSSQAGFRSATDRYSGKAPPLDVSTGREGGDFRTNENRSDLPTLSAAATPPAPRWMDDKSLGANNSGGPASDIGAIIGAVAQKWMGEYVSRMTLDHFTRADEPVSLRRSLDAGDFAELNALFKGTIIKLPDAPIQTKIIGITLDLKLTNIRCFDMNVQDIAVSYAMDSNQKLSFRIDIIGLDLDCDTNWRYNYGVFHDGGKAQFRSDDNRVDTVIGFKSEDFSKHPPNGSSVDSCSSTINISDIKITEGDFLAQAFDFFEGLLRGRIAGQIGDVACDELGGLGSGTVSDLLDFVAETIDGYQEDLPWELANPLYAEENLDLANDVRLLDFTTTDESIGGWFNSALQQADELFGSVIDDPNSPVGNGKDLGINKILRSTLLDGDRAYVIPVSDWPESVANGGILMQTHDMLTETSMVLTQVKLFGLDTFTRFDPLLNIGKHSLYNHLDWDHITFELNLTVTMKPSSSSESIIINPSIPEQVEHIQIRTGVNKVQSTIAFMLALDQDRLGNIQLGSMMHVDQILPCLLGALYGVELTALTVDVGSIQTPTITGFISKGIDSLLGTSSRAVFDMYEASLLEAVPNFFQMTVRKMVNDMAIAYTSDPKNIFCPPAYAGEPGADSPVDFRDLLMLPAEAKAAGASGEAPYGDIGSMAMNLLDSQLLSSDAQGSMKINSLAIQPVTEAQSGTAGMLRFPSNIFSLVKDNITHVVWSAFAERMELRAFDTRIRNLDTMREPVSLLQPLGKWMLQNNFNFGHSESGDAPASRPLNGALRLLIGIDDEGSPLWMRNDLDVSISVASTGLVADILAAVSEQRFMEIPLKHIMNGKCWLATIPAPQLDENGIRIAEGGDIIGISLSDFALMLYSLKLDMNCVDCTSSGLLKIPDIVQDLDDLGAITVLKNRLVGFATDLLEGQWMQSKVDMLLDEAPKNCPHNPDYDVNFVPAKYVGVGFPPLSRDTLELFIYAATLMLQIGAVAGAESHVGFVTEPIDPLSSQSSLDVPDGTNVFDFSRLGGWAGSVMEDVKASLGSVVIDPDGPNADTTGEDLFVNVLLRSSILNEDRALEIPVNQSIEEGNVHISLDEVRILGLDTLTTFDVLNVIDKQTFLHRFSWDDLGLELDISIGTSSSKSVHESRMMAEGLERMTFGMSLSDIDATVATLLAVDIDRLGDLQLGSILHTDQLASCLLSTARAVELAQLSVTVKDISEPAIKGFISEELRDDISAAFQMIFAKYKSLMLDAIPNFFDVTVRKLVNNIVDSFIKEEQSKGCSTPSLSSIFPNPIDFRELLLPKAEAVALGARGGAYGSLFSRIFRVVDQQFLSAESDGIPKLNDAVIRPLTLGQSGTEGDLLFQGNLAQYTSSDVPLPGIDGIDFRAHNALVQNLDSFGNPLKLLKPRAASPYHLDNVATLGVGPEPLSGSLRLFFEVEGDPVIQMSNDLAVGITIGMSEVLAAILAKVDEKKFVHLPLRDLFNPYCWLATIPAPLLDKMGLREVGEPNLALDDFALSLASLQFNISCVNCSTGGLVELPELINTLDQAGVVADLMNRLADFTVELIEGDLVQVQIDRLLAGAPKQCPHNSDYDSSFVPVDYESIGSIELSRDSLETIIFSGAVFVQSIIVVGAKTHAIYKTEDRDPLSGQASLEVPPDLRLLNFSDLGSSVGTWADSILDEVNGYLGETMQDPDSPSGEGLGVNVFLRSSLLGKDRSLDIPVEDLSIEEGGIMISLHAVRIFGLDTFVSLNVLDVIGSQTLLNEISLKNLSLEVQVAIDMDPRTPGDAEIMTFAISLHDIDATVALLLAIDLDRLGDLRLGSMLHTENILPCLLSAMYAVDLTKLSVSVGDISEPTISGFVSPELKEILSKSTQAIFYKYKSMMLEAIPSFFDVTVRTLLNNIIDEYMSKESGESCPFPLVLDDSSVVDFRDLLLPESDALVLGASGESPYGDLFRSLKNIVDEQVLAVDPVTGMSKMNDMVIRPLTKQQSNVAGMLRYPGDVFGGEKNIAVGGFKANIEIRVYDVRIENLDTLGRPLSLLQPIMDDRSVLNNTATMGVEQAPLSLNLTLLLSIQGDDNMQMRNELNLGVDLKSAMVLLEALVKISEAPFFDFPLRDMLNVNCWLATIASPPLDKYGVRVDGSETTLAVNQLAMSIAEMRLRLNCIDCSSPGLRDISGLMSSPKAVEDATVVANMLVDSATQFLGGKYMQIQFDRMLREAATKCPHNDAFDAGFQGYEYQAFQSPDTEESAASFFVAMAVVGVLLFVLGAVIIFIVKWIVRRRHRRWIKTLREDEIFHIHMSQIYEQKREKELCQRTTAMAMSKVVPLALRIFMPLIILGNIGFFLSGHLSKGATVSINIHLAEEDLVVEDFFIFSMARSTVDMWKAGAKPLAMLILIFSGIWPYTKQLITLVLWFTPPRWVSVTRRGTIFLWLDILAKWSMIDIFVLLVSMAAFRVSVQSPDLAFLPEGFYSLDLLIIPLWGLYANMTAQLISQISSHFIIHYHRKMADAAMREDYEEQQLSVKTRDLCSGESEDYGCDASFQMGQLQETREVLRDHRFEMNCDKEGQHAMVPRWVSYVLLISAVLIAAFVVWGCVWTSFSLEVLGMVGLAVESGQEFQQAVTEHNLFSMVGAVMDQARYLDIGKYYLGLGILSSLLVTTVLFVPLFQAATLLWIWFCQMTRRSRQRAKAAIEILQAWQYVEVYILSIIVAAWQIGGVSDFMVNDHCGGLEDTFASMAYYGIIAETDAQCFRVEARLEGATYVLLVSACILSLMNHFVMKAAEQRDHDKETANRPVGKIEFDEDMSDDPGSDRASKIHPVLPRFTDFYRWIVVLELLPVNDGESLFSDEPDVREADGTLGIKAIPTDVNDGGSHFSEPDAIEADGTLGIRAITTDISTVPSAEESVSYFACNESSGEERNSYLPTKYVNV